MQVKADAKLVEDGVVDRLKNGLSFIDKRLYVGDFRDWHDQSRQCFIAMTIDGRS
jgi:hypothetical protein